MIRLLLSLLLLAAAALRAQAQFTPGTDIRKALQNQLIMAESGDTVTLPPGTFFANGSLSLDEKEHVVIRGAGIGRTILSFKNQTDGAEGIRISNCRNIRIEGMTVQDAKGDCIKAQNTDGIVFYEVKVEWTGKPKESNGAYGLYPVQCTNVLIDRCEAVGASDAGIYVGQSHNIIVRNSRAYHNVAGIEIENSTLADVHHCEATGNTGGILVFDLPDLPKKKGGNVRVFSNKVWENNYRNFAPKGNTVATVPPGTGVMVLATSDVEVYDNDITNNITAGLAIISYFVTENEIKDAAYDPYPTGIYVHHNRFSREAVKPTLKNKIGIKLALEFGRNVPDILWDGITRSGTTGPDGRLLDPYRICIRENGDAGYANLDIGNNFKAISRDLAPHDCERGALHAPEDMASNR